MVELRRTSKISQPDKPEVGSVYLGQVLDAALGAAEVVVGVVLGDASRRAARRHVAQPVELVVRLVQHLQSGRLDVPLAALVNCEQRQ